MCTMRAARPPTPSPGTNSPGAWSRHRTPEPRLPHQDTAPPPAARGPRRSLGSYAETHTWSTPAPSTAPRGAAAHWAAATHPARASCPRPSTRLHPHPCPPRAAAAAESACVRASRRTPSRDARAVVPSSRNARQDPCLAGAAARTTSERVSTPSRRAGRADAGGLGTDPAHTDPPAGSASTPAETPADAAHAPAAVRPPHCRALHVCACAAPCAAGPARRTTGPVGLAWQGTPPSTRQAR